MNKNRKPISGKLRKAMEKEVRKGQKELQPEDLPRTDTLTPQKVLAKYPAKTKKADKALMDSTIKGMKIKKKRGVAKLAKRTTPGEVSHREAQPAHAHIESTEWQKTIIKQNKNRRVLLTKKLQKSTPKRKIK